MLSKVLLLISGVSLIISIFVPIWRIELDAPQYPEGLKLLIYANHLGGNVDIINGLNHYIGMKTLHAEEFIEFTVLPYIIGFYALLCFVAALLGRKKFVYTLLGLFILFGIIAMADFWRWEYDYGHNLNPEAAIIVPGMAYQPPLIGFKQLLNFGAYSVPDIGGWLFILSGILMVLSTLKEMNVMKRFTKTKTALASLSLLLIFMSCSSDAPVAIKLNKDNCDFCKMTIANGHMAAEIKTTKGRAYKFDDISCLFNYIKEHNDLKVCAYYVNDFLGDNQLIDAEKAFFIQGDKIASPMGGHIAAFQHREVAIPYLKKYDAAETTWVSLLK